MKIIKALLVAAWLVAAVSFLVLNLYYPAPFTGWYWVVFTLVYFFAAPPLIWVTLREAKRHKVNQ